MNENIFNTLEAIDVVQESALDTQLDVLVACDNAYSKYCMFSESYNGDVDELGFFTEGAIGDEMKKMKGENENALVSIIMALPRFIAAIIKTITKKTENVEKELKAQDNDEATKKRAVLISSIIDDYEKNGKKSQMLIKLEKALLKICKVSVVTGLGAGLVLHFSPATETVTDSEGNTSEAKKVTTWRGFEVCVTKDGSVSMTKEFVENFEKLDKEFAELKRGIDSGTVTADEETIRRYKELDKTINDMTKFANKYNGQNAKDVGLTGILGFIKKSSSWLFDMQKCAERMGNNLKEKSKNSNVVVKTGVAVIDKIIRATTLVLKQLIEYGKMVAQAIVKLVMIPIDAIHEFIKKDNKKKKDDNVVDAESNKDDDKNNDEKKNEDKTTDDDADDKKIEDESEKKDEAEDDSVTKESTVEEVHEGETVTQESANTEETNEPVDPVVSSWYNK